MNPNPYSYRNENGVVVTIPHDGTEHGKQEAAVTAARKGRMADLKRACRAFPKEERAEAARYLAMMFDDMLRPYRVGTSGEVIVVVDGEERIARRGGR